LLPCPARPSTSFNVSQDWNAYLDALKPEGKLHIPGAVLEPLNIGGMLLLFGQKSVSGSPVGSPATISTMLDFAACHDVEHVTEHFPMS